MFDGSLPVAATFSKDPKMFARGFEPIELRQGYGARVSATDGREYLDWISALGANLLGYGHEDWLSSVQAQAMQGAGFSLPHVLERQVADKLVNLLGTHVPGWAPEGLGVRFGLSGTDATTMAVRLARVVTGRQRIVSVGYHGWSDVFVGLTPPHWGVHSCPHEYNQSCNFGDLSTLAFMLGSNQVATVIIEQTTQGPTVGYWRAVRKLCNESSALLIVDEVVTWPRFALGGACELYDIEPDIVCLGKGLGNGLPISAIVGRREYFDWFARPDPCFVSSTHFGNAVSLAAADAVLDIWDESCGFHIWIIGKALMDGLRALGYKIIGHPPRFLIDFESLAHKTYFVLGMRDRGILWNRPTLPNLAHTREDVAETVLAAAEIKQRMATMDVEELMAEKLPMVLFEGR